MGNDLVWEARDGPLDFPGCRGWAEATSERPDFVGVGQAAQRLALTLVQETVREEAGDIAGDLIARLGRRQHRAVVGQDRRACPGAASDAGWLGLATIAR